MEALDLIIGYLSNGQEKASKNIVIRYGKLIIKNE